MKCAPSFVAVFLAALLGGCALSTPPQHSDVVNQALPKGTTVPPAWMSDASGAPVADDWLKSLDDPLLDAIVAEAIANNLDLRQAAERVTIAQQSAVVVGSQLLPQIGAVLGGRSTRDIDHSKDSNTTI
ncbi:TolC family protein, partial [Caballeronia glathei]|uniref:TolC family protein n=1 Tax=Caballeronia glathei TaxID=60547 RepID=UPI00056426FD